jgi:hypothetical protein
VAIWARAQTKHRMPPLADYLVTRDPPVPDSPQTKIAKLRSALEVLSAQTGIPLRRAQKVASTNGQ